MTKNGRPITVVVDEWIPCRDGQPAFSRAHGPEIWVILLEKAWAKIHGSYERIKHSHAHLAMQDLTSAPSITYNIELNRDKIFELFAEA